MKNNQAQLKCERNIQDELAVRGDALKKQNGGFSLNRRSTDRNISTSAEVRCNSRGLLLPARGSWRSGVS